MLIAVWLFLFGLICGSFANAVIWRIKVGRSVARGRSVCPNCEVQLRAIDLVPVLSYIALKGRCRDCRERISLWYPTIELLTGILFFGAWFTLNPDSLVGWIDLGFWLYIIVSLMILAVYDLRWMILPDVVLVPAIAIAILRLPLYLALGQPFSVVRGPLIAALAGGAAFYSIAAVSKGKWMGGGDIKLVFLIGLLLGIQKGLLAMFLATTAAALVGGTLLLLRKLHSRYIAFGPFLAAATVAALFYGTELIAFYLSLSGLDTF